MTLTKRDKTMLAVLLFAVIGTILILTVGRQLLGGGAPAAEIKLTPVPAVDAGFLNDSRFKGLVAPRGLPVQAGKTGNPDPFRAPKPETAATSTL